MKSVRRPASRDDDDITNVGADMRGLEEEEDDEDEASLSLAAMEAELRPQVMETFDVIADTYKKLRKLQDQQVENRLAASGTLSPSQERRHKELKEQLIKAVKSLSLNTARIEALVEQLYDINKRLVQNEGKLLRLAESYGVKREQFLEQYQGSELDPELDEVDRQPVGARLEGVHQEREGDDQGAALRDPEPRHRDRDLDPGIPQDRQPGPEGRARSGDRQEGNGRGEPAPRHLDREEVHEPRPAIP